MKAKNLVFIIVFFFSSLLWKWFGINDYYQAGDLIAQPTLTWAKSMGGINNDQAYSIVVDGSGNVYTTGHFVGTVDFDPSAAVYNLVSAGNYDFFVSKLDALGNFVWAKRMGGPGVDRSNSIALDGSGNVFTTGYYNGTADFDPGAASNNLTSAGNTDIFISKLDASGSFLWAKSMGGAGDDEGMSITLDGTGNVYTTGYYNGTADFDPGAAVYNLVSAGNYDIFVSKLDALGNFVWAKSLGGPGLDYGTSITVDGSSNVYTTGRFLTTADFDPGAAVFNLVSAGSNEVFVSRLDASGNFVWAKRMGGTGIEAGASIALDGNGNVFTTGGFEGTADFNPGAAVFNLLSAGPAGTYDIFVSKLDALGNFVWAFSVGAALSEYANSIALDPSGNVYIMGDQYSSTVDYDPGAGSFNVNTLGGPAGEANFIAKYDNNANFICAMSITPGHNETYVNRHLAVDGSGMVWAAASFNDATTDFDPCPPIFNPGYSANNDIYIAKYDFNNCNCSVPALQVTVTGTTILCNGQCTGTATANAVNGTGPYTYSWNAGLQTTQVATGLCAGTYTVIVTDMSGGTSTATVIITQPATAIASSISNSVNASCNSLCNGSAIAGAVGGTPVYTYLWSSVPPQNTASATGLCSGTYTVLVTDSNGCTSSQTVSITEPAALTASQSGTVCAGSGYTLPGGTVVNTSGTYTDTLIAVSGCDSIITTVLTVNLSPTVTISPNVTIVQGAATTLSSSGGGNYQWSNGASLQNINVSPVLTTTYCVTVTDANGCIAIACVTVVVDMQCGKIYLPNAFSPNADGQNDEFCLQGGIDYCIKEIHINIYDRWGERVYESRDKNFCWDGMCQGRQQNTAVFVYYLDATLINGEKISKKGNVSSIR